MDIKSLTDQPGKLPTVPRVAQKIIASFGDAEVSVTEIAALIATDPALSAKLLWLANSSYFQVSKTIGTLDNAMAILGTVMVRNLVLGNGLAAAFRNTPGIEMHLFWRYNLYASCGARWLAKQLGLNADEAFTLGLMHAIGQMQLHTIAPAAVAPLDQQLNVLDAKRHALETAALGFHYGDVSAALANLWNFPPALVNALAAIPDPLGKDEFSATAACVHLGAWRARCEVGGSSDADIVASYPTEVAQRLGIQPGWVMQLAAPSPAKSVAAMPPFEELTLGLESLLN
jgi:HD-like signal output (HDOD) protein